MPKTKEEFKKLCSQTVSGILEEAKQLQIEKEKVYGDSYLKHGRIMNAFFPDGIVLKGTDEFNLFALFDLLVVKMNRISTYWDNGIHKDSIKDLIVYSAILKRVSDRTKESKE